MVLSKIMTSKAEILHDFKTTLHPCGLENIKIDGNHIVACGCYELDEEQQHRNGGIVIYNYKNEALEEISSISVPSGVLDLRLTKEFVIAALASESLHFYSTNTNQGNVLVHSVTKPNEGLFLSLDTLISQDTQQLQSVVVSTQASSILRYQVTESEIVETVHIPNTHMMFSEPMPAWIVANDPFQEQILLSGGDDMKFRLWDLRDVSVAAHTNKTHTAGVTCAQWHPYQEHLFVTGSYDESFQIWDMRKMQQSLLRVETGKFHCTLMYCIPLFSLSFDLICQWAYFLPSFMNIRWWCMEN